MLKRIFDICVSAAALIALSPAILIVAILVRVNLGAPIFFRQVRPGVHGKPFEMIKFRSMLNAWDEHGQPLPNDKRLTKFGRLLR